MRSLYSNCTCSGVKIDFEIAGTVEVTGTPGTEEATGTVDATGTEGGEGLNV
jgi:hypothetical protein